MRKKLKVISKWLFVVILLISMVLNCILATKVVNYNDEVKDIKIELKTQTDLNTELTEQLNTTKESEQYLLGEVDARDATIEQLKQEITTLKKK